MPPGTDAAALSMRATRQARGIHDAIMPLSPFPRDRSPAPTAPALLRASRHHYRQRLKAGMPKATSCRGVAIVGSPLNNEGRWPQGLFCISRRRAAQGAMSAAG